MKQIVFTLQSNGMYVKSVIEDGVVPQPTPNPTPDTPPYIPPYVPPVATGDAIALNMDGGVWPAGGPLVASGPYGLALWFIADKARFPKRIEIKMLDQSPQGGTMDLVISDKPHDFTPVGGQASGAKLSVNLSDSVILILGPAEKWYDCSVVPGGQYFLNVRPSSQAGSVFPQFTVTNRPS